MMQGDLAGMLAAQGEPMTAPTMQNPGGMPSGPQDPTAQGCQIAVATLKRLAQELEMRGKPEFANQVDAMAVKLNKLYLKEQQKLQDLYSQLQSTTMGALM